jgi:hypothetical protein
MFTLFIFNKQRQQQEQVEEVNTADAIRAVETAMRGYIVSNWEALIKGGPINGVDVDPIPAEGDILSVDIADAELAGYLPQGFLIDNNFNQAFHIAIQRRDPTTTRMPIQTVIMSGRENKRGIPFDSLSGVRIAAMVGSGGGVIRRPFNPGEQSGMAYGTLGTWQLDMKQYFDPDLTTPVRLVSTVDFTLEDVEHPLRNSVLYREEMDRFPHGNEMVLTDIDMNGNAMVDLRKLKYKVPNDTGDFDFEDGFIIDAENGSIRMKIKSETKTVAMGATHFDGANSAYISHGTTKTGTETDYYGIQPENVSTLYDIRLGALKGDKLSEIIPTISLKASYKNKRSGDNILAPNCPIGWAPIIDVIPTTAAAGTTKSTSLSTSGPRLDCNIGACAVNCTLNKYTGCTKTTCTGGQVSCTATPPSGNFAAPPDFTGADAYAVINNDASTGKTKSWDLVATGHYASYNLNVNTYCKMVID